MRTHTAVVLGSRPGSGNIGEAIARRLEEDQKWLVQEDDCARSDGGDGIYYAPPPVVAPCWDADALVVTLGLSMVEEFHKAPFGIISDVLEACLELPLQCAQRYIQNRGERGGKVVFIGSYAHDHPITMGTAYCAAKAGLAAATKNLAWDYGKDGYQFHIVHPYHTPGTPMWEAVQSEVVANRGMTREEAEAYAAKDLRFDSHLTPRDIGSIVHMLLTTHAARWMSGAGVNLYGGVR